MDLFVLFSMLTILLITILTVANNPVIPSLFIEDGFFFLCIILASLSLSGVHRFVDL